jgi:hypothetical protein
MSEALPGRVPIQLVQPDRLGSEQANFDGLAWLKLPDVRVRPRLGDAQQLLRFGVPKQKLPVLPADELGVPKFCRDEPHVIAPDDNVLSMDRTAGKHLEDELNRVAIAGHDESPFQHQPVVAVELDNQPSGSVERVHSHVSAA